MKCAPGNPDSTRGRVTFSDEYQHVKANSEFCPVNDSFFARAVAKRRSFMDQNSNYITIEMNIRLQMKDYRLVLGTKRVWILTIVVGITQLIAWLAKYHS